MTGHHEPRDPHPTREDLQAPVNRPTWGNGRPVLSPFPGVVLLIVVVLGIFALLTFLRYNT